MVNLCAQSEFPEGTPCVKGYNIKVTTQIPYEKLYLVGYYGSQEYCIDSCVVKRGAATFKSKNPTPCGVYALSSAPANRPILNVILNQDTKFTIHLLETENANGMHSRTVTTEGSEENLNFLNFLARTPQSEIPARCKEMLTTMPESFLAKYLMAAYGIDNQLVYNCRSDRALTQAHLDVTDLSEPKLLHTPLQVFSMLTKPIEKEDFQNSDSVIAYLKNALSRASNPLVRNYLVASLFQKLDIHNPEYDPALIYLYDHYDKGWIENGREARFKRKIDNLRKIVPGAQIPELISHDKDGKKHSTNEITTHYTVLWFWDPDCDHCQEMTPILHQMYQENADNWDFEVFAVEVNEDHDRWISFSDKNNLWDWVNLSTSMGEANLDYIEYFDIMTTPVIFLVDNSQDHTIIARQITLDELSTILSNQ